LSTNVDFAQFAADIDYRLPAPPPSPRLHVATGERRVDLYWDDSPESVSDPTSLAPGGRDFEGYRLWLGLDRQAPVRVAQFDLGTTPNDTTGFNTGFGAIRETMSSMVSPTAITTRSPGSGTASATSAR